MRNFKLIFTFIGAIALLLTSCSKEESESAIEGSTDKATLSFGATLNDLLNNRSQTKNHFSDVPECSDAAPASVMVVLSMGGEAMDAVTLDVLSDDLNNDGVMDYFTDYSGDLELTPGTYQLEEFIVYDDSNNMIWIAPIDEDDSGEYNGYVTDALPITINLGAGVKKYVDVEVLCYDDREVNQYGYLFFDIIPRELYELCFFTNYCTENGRHYTANYSVDLWYVIEGADDELLIEDSMPVTDINQYGDYYAEPVCMTIPAPMLGEDGEDGYLYYEVTLLDWEGNYSDIEDGSITKSGYLSWNEIEDLLDADENDSTVDYWHVFLGCGQDDGQTGGGNGGGEDCENTDPTADCDDDGVANRCDENAVGYGEFDCDNDGIDNMDENDGCVDDSDPNCGEEVAEEPEPCLPTADTGCITSTFEGTVSNDFPIEWIYNDTAIGTLRFTVEEDGDLVVGATFFVQEGYSMDNIEILVNGEVIKCTDTDLASTLYQITVEGDFSYTDLEVEVRANLCNILE
ncbi:hypothetical protein RM545_04520 [Zunongwangia sp. F260]|uniref:Lipoprotein n=1 Tax=Autumnicola lenta TaxID=3075593 RepID=A0ABU3CHX6_9FLAO|nr:hypothetical protein [Zunongwangia sp. F260]MDT0645944.1 hypothetical protein [Zunongwangia sp. F260]